MELPTMHERRVIRTGPYPVVRIVVPPMSRQGLIGISDMHMGHPGHRSDMLDQKIEWVLENDALWFGGGDYIENWVEGSPGDGFTQILKPGEQIEMVVEKLSPIKHLCIGMLWGNHEQRTWRKVGIDPAHEICKQLWGLEQDMYCKTELFATITSAQPDNGYHGASYSLYATHSGSGHKNSGTAIAHMQRDWTFVQADLKFKAHDHHVDFDWEEVLDVQKTHNHVKEKRQYLILMGSDLHRAGTYATKKPHAPTTVGGVGVWLDMREGRRKVRPEYLLDD